MPKRRLTLLSIITTEGIHYDIPARNVELLRWARTSTCAGIATLSMVDGTAHEVAMDLPVYNALVADWALSAPGRTRGLQFAILAHAKAGRLKGDEVWPRNKA